MPRQGARAMEVEGREYQQDVLWSKVVDGGTAVDDGCTPWISVGEG